MNKTKVDKRLLIFIFGLVLFLFSLVYILLNFKDKNTKVEKVESLSPTNVPELTEGITPYQLPTSVPQLPTMTINQQEVFMENLSISNCMPPCFLGITPGETMIDEAKVLLEKMGAILPPETPYWLNDELEQYYYIMNLNFNSIIFRQSIHMIVKNNQIIHIKAFLENQQTQIFYDLYSQYSVRQTLVQLGIPDQVYVYSGEYDFNPAYSIQFKYENSGIILISLGRKQNGLICPSFEDDKTKAITLIFSEPSLYDTISSVSNDFVVDLEYKKSISDVFSITEQQFYDQILSDPDVCFEPVDGEH